MQFLIDNKVPVLAGLFFLSEILALVPSIKANSVFQMIFGLISKAKDAVSPPVA